MNDISHGPNLGIYDLHVKTSLNKQSVRVVFEALQKNSFCM